MMHKEKIEKIKKIEKNKIENKLLLFYELWENVTYIGKRGIEEFLAKKLLLYKREEEFLEYVYDFFQNFQKKGITLLDFSLNLGNQEEKHILLKILVDDKPISLRIKFKNSFENLPVPEEDIEGFLYFFMFYEPKRFGRMWWNIHHFLRWKGVELQNYNPPKCEGSWEEYFKLVFPKTYGYEFPGEEVDYYSAVLFSSFYLFLLNYYNKINKEVLEYLYTKRKDILRFLHEHPRSGEILLYGGNPYEVKHNLFSRLEKIILKAEPKDVVKLPKLIETLLKIKP